jgi:hypothetical protein
MLQRDRLFALLGSAEIARELEITDKQRQQFGEVAQEMHRKIGPLIRPDSGDPERRQPAGDRAEDQGDPQGTGRSN